MHFGSDVHCDCEWKLLVPLGLVFCVDAFVLCTFWIRESRQLAKDRAISLLEKNGCTHFMEEERAACGVQGLRFGNIVVLSSWYILVK